jgi:uncharacterized RDD family membrane protein YckC
MQGPHLSGDGSDAYDPDLHPGLYRDVLARRIVAFIIDAIVVVLLWLPVFLVLLVLTIITFGLAWILMPPAFAIVALAYVALTLGGPQSATVGQRVMGIELRAGTGMRPYPLLAIIHASLFWVSMTLTPLILLVGLFNTRRRLLHDILTGTVMLDSDALARFEGRGPPFLAPGA